jgi:hypothetical protein
MGKLGRKENAKPSFKTKYDHLRRLSNTSGTSGAIPKLFL